MSAVTLYIALYGLLHSIWVATDSDDIASLLGDMSLLEDGISADSDMMSRWMSFGPMDSIDAGYTAAVEFIRMEVALTRSSHLASLLECLESNASAAPENSLMKGAWVVHVERAAKGGIDAKLRLA